MKLPERREKKHSPLHKRSREINLIETLYKYFQLTGRRIVTDTFHLYIVGRVSVLV